MSQISEEIESLRKELNDKNIEIENNNKLMSKVSRERDVSVKYNNELRNQLEVLNAKLHLHQNVIKTITNCMETQTDDNQMVCCHCNKSMSNSQNETIGSNSWKEKSETNNTRISDLVRETAEEVVLQNNFENDYCYDQKSKTYYSRSSGWFYYPDRFLFYDPHTKNYYKYDSEKKVYNFYSSLQQTDNKRENTTKSSKSKKSKKNIQEVLKQEENEIPVSATNTTSDTETIDCSEEEEGEIESSDENSNSSIEFISEEKMDCGPPLVRMIVKESSTLEIGSLLIVTCMGAKVGNDSNCDVWITDKSVSRSHAEIRFDEISKSYMIKDLNSTNGTFSNGVKIENDCEIALKHYDQICFGECLLLVHIHEGLNVTCDQCEPGVIMANLKTTEKSINILHEQRDSEKDRQKNLKLLKKKYGLSHIDFCEVKVMTPSNYKDRTHERRKEKGSDNPYEKTAIGTSIDTALSNSNKGFKILEKMGWTSGEALGRHQNGNTEPILVEVRDNRSGLGYQQNFDDLTPKSYNSKPELKLSNKYEKWKKAQQRFDQT